MPKQTNQSYIQPLPAVSPRGFLSAAIMGMLFSTVACSGLKAESPKSPVLAQSNTNGVKSIPEIATEAEDTQLSAANTAAVHNTEEAKRLAEQHVALRKRSWGSVKNVSEGDGVFYVSFDTPEQEMKLLGPRVVVIDKQTGAATVQLRR